MARLCGNGFPAPRPVTPPAYKGHNPVGRLMLALLFFLLGVQMITGLVLAGTDRRMQFAERSFDARGNEGPTARYEFSAAP